MYISYAVYNKLQAITISMKKFKVEINNKYINTEAFQKFSFHRCAYNNLLYYIYFIYTLYALI